MSYPDGIVPTTQRVHPTPLYETLAGLVIFAILWRLRTRLSAWRLVGVYLVLSGAERFAVELVRRNEEILAGVTQPQLWALGGALAGLALVAAARPGDPRSRLPRDFRGRSERAAAAPLGGRAADR